MRPNGGHAVVLNWSMFTLYGMNKHEVRVHTPSYSTLELIDCQFPSINLYFSSSISVYTSEVIMVTVYLR